MDSSERGNNLRVGIFLALGLAAVALTVVYFGRLGDGFRNYYEIRVEYPNASGLLKGANVLLAGAKVGLVATPPTILPDMQGVYVMLKIYEEVEIPSASKFTIGSSGLLGDRFVEIVLEKNAKGSEPIAPGAVIHGRGESGGFGELTGSAGDLMQEIKGAVANINTIATRIDKEILGEEMVTELKSTITNIEKTSAAFAEASREIDGLVARAREIMDSGEETMGSARSAAGEFEKAMADARRVLGEARKLLSQARNGGGSLGTLLADRETAENLRALVENLRRHGILWYRDSASSQR